MQQASSMARALLQGMLRMRCPMGNPWRSLPCLMGRLPASHLTLPATWRSVDTPPPQQPHSDKDMIFSACIPASAEGSIPAQGIKALPNTRSAAYASCLVSPLAHSCAYGKTPPDTVVELSIYVSWKGQADMAELPRAPSVCGDRCHCRYWRCWKRGRWTPNILTGRSWAFSGTHCM